MGDYNLPEQEATIVKHLLTNIASAVCRRLDAIDEQLESVCINTWYIENHIDEVWPCSSKHHAVSAQAKSSVHVTDIWQNDAASQDSGEVALVDLLTTVKADNSVNIITLNSESDYPDGSWLGDVHNSLKRVRVPISPVDLTHVHANCHTAVKMALTLLDYLFDRDTQAVSNLSGTGKHSKQQLDPLMIYGIQCHLEKCFGISSEEWQQIRLNIDSKCRSAYRRKLLGLPLAVKAFRFRSPQAGTSASDDNSDNCVNGGDSFHDDLEVGVTSHVASDTTDDDICIDDGAKMHVVCLTGSQLSSLGDSHGVVHIEVQNMADSGLSEDPLYHTMFNAVVKQSNVVSPVDATAASAHVDQWTDVEVIND